MLENSDEVSDKLLATDAIAPPLASAAFDAKLEPMSVMLLDWQKTAPPCDVLAVFITNAEPLEVSVLASKLTAPPVVSAVFISKVVVAVVLVNELDDAP